jgi:hypothetical protein
VTVVLAIANQNRGVGKTVTAANVAAGFARAGRRTLAVDCDAQADLTRWLLGRLDQDAAISKATPLGALGTDAIVRAGPLELTGPAAALRALADACEQAATMAADYDADPAGYDERERDARAEAGG